jgi:glycosyltransferase involved in cell wall biosynthesis
MRRLVTHTIAVSYDLADFLVSEYRIEPERISTIPNGIDVGRFAAGLDVTGIREQLGISGDKRIIGTIGRLMEQKGTEYLIRAYAVLARAHPDTCLVIVGDGELRGGLERLAGDLGVGDSVIFTGIRQDIPEMLTLFDIFVLPSLWEGQPITIMEAMAAGKPVVATDAGGNEEILHRGEFGMIVPTHDPGALCDAIGKLLADRALARQLGERARDQACSELTSAVMTRRHEKIFESLF